MLISNTVLVKKYLKIMALVFFFSGMIFVSPVLAATPSFSIYPAGGIVTNKDKGFTVDVMIDSAGEELTSARFVITFDPEYLKLTKTERNNALFAQWPEDEATIDNTNGVVMLTGFSQSGADELYITQSEPDIMARLSFDVIKVGETSLDWEFTGSDDTFSSVMLVDGSPPQNVLKTKPAAVTFTIQREIVSTAIEWNKYVLVGGLILILFGGLIMFSRPKGFSKKDGTVVVYEEE
jgi:hypothetical protein